MSQQQAMMIHAWARMIPVRPEESTTNDYESIAGHDESAMGSD